LNRVVEELSEFDKLLKQCKELEKEYRYYRTKYYLTEQVLEDIKEENKQLKERLVKLRAEMNGRKELF
jgi:septal ring factor EnvC (AmiA/AmiB activator)